MKIKIKIVSALWKFFLDNKKLILKYGIVGATSAVVDFGILFILTDWFGFYYLVSATISFIVAALVNYILNRHWTFRSNGQRRKQVPIFIAIAVLGILLNNNIMYVCVEHWHLHYLWAKVIATAIVTFWNFFGNKYLTFKL